MATMQDVATRAYRIIGVVADDEPMTAEQGANAVEAFNAMVAGWASDGKHTMAVTVEMGDEFPLPANLLNAATRLLAAELAPQYGRQVPDTRRDWRHVSTTYIVVPDLSLPRTLTRLPSQEGYGLEN